MPEPTQGKKPLAPIEAAPESQSLENVSPPGTFPKDPSETKSVNEDLPKEPTFKDIEKTIAVEVTTHVPLDMYVLDPTKYKDQA